MTARARREFERYVRYIADRMELRDWTIRVDHDSCDAKHTEGFQWQAKCSPVPGRKFAILTFDPSCFTDLNRHELRQTVVHELVHCHFYGLWDTVRQDSLDLIAEQDAYDVLIAGVRRHLEYGVDAVADAIAPRMPLIKWPKEKA
jgi:hypothetical protein